MSLKCIYIHQCETICAALYEARRSYYISSAKAHNTKPGWIDRVAVLHTETMKAFKA